MHSLSEYQQAEGQDRNYATRRKLNNSDMFMESSQIRASHLAPNKAVIHDVQLQKGKLFSGIKCSHSSMSEKKWFLNRRNKGRCCHKKMLTLGHVYSAEIKSTRNYTGAPFPLTPPLRYNIMIPSNKLHL